MKSIDPRALRRSILEQSFRAGVGHIGSALSVADIIAVLYSGLIEPRRRGDLEGDMFVLSKGHAALALYCALHLNGTMDAATLDTFCGDNSLLGVHPEHGLAGVDFSTGSLGQGLSTAAGAAFAARLRGWAGRTTALISDAELNEGSTWEAIMFAGHHRLSNLTLIVDDNGQQALAPSREVIDLGDIAAKLRSFGWDADDVDGHDPTALDLALRRAPAERARALVAHTVSGSGVSFMERQVRWHYASMKAAEFQQAMAELA